MTAAAITRDHPIFQEIKNQITSAITKIKMVGKATRHDRTQWHQLLARANKRIVTFSKKAKEEIKAVLKELEDLLSAFIERRKRPRNSHPRTCSVC